MYVCVNVSVSTAESSDVKRSAKMASSSTSQHATDQLLQVLATAMFETQRVSNINEMWDKLSKVCETN